MEVFRFLCKLFLEIPYKCIYILYSQAVRERACFQAPCSAPLLPVTLSVAVLLGACMFGITTCSPVIFFLVGIEHSSLPKSSYMSRILLNVFGTLLVVPFSFVS